jgi:hypothetical protein
MDLILSQLNLVQTFTAYLVKIHFTNILIERVGIAVMF